MQSVAFSFLHRKERTGSSCSQAPCKETTSRIFRSMSQRRQSRKRTGFICRCSYTRRIPKASTCRTEAGVDVLAHTTPGTPDWTPALVSRLRRARMALIPTVTLFDFESRRDGDSEEARENLLGRMVSELRTFTAGGGQVLFGSDVGYMDHFETGLEFRLMAQAGLDYRQILATLTTNPARRFELSRHAGRVQSGFEGDLVVLDGDPAQDVENFARVRYTIAPVKSSAPHNDLRCCAGVSRAPLALAARIMNLSEEGITSVTTSAVR